MRNPVLEGHFESLEAKLDTVIAELKDNKLKMKDVLARLAQLEKLCQPATK